jgi:hypothetical protein
MGCDIHLTLEKRLGDKWICIDTFKSHQDSNGHGHSMPVAKDRNYKRFAALAGVRGAGPEPKGVPADVSDTTRYLINEWRGDGHSHSWLSLDEATRIFLDTQWAPPGHELPSFILEHPDSHFFNVDCSHGSGETVGDYRIVFWFDN